jgi:hypothetical protein
MVNISVHWVITCSIVETQFSKRIKFFVRNKVIRNILINVNLMEMIIIKLGL